MTVFISKLFTCLVCKLYAQSEPLEDRTAAEETRLTWKYNSHNQKVVLPEILQDGKKKVYVSFASYSAYIITK